MKELGLVLSTSDPCDLTRAAGLARAARRRGLEVSLFLMDAAVAWGADPTLAALLDEGCEVVACATSVDARGAAPPVAGVVLGSQDDHAAIVHRAAWVVAFT